MEPVLAAAGAHGFLCPSRDPSPPVSPSGRRPFGRPDAVDVEGRGYLVASRPGIAARLLLDVDRDDDAGRHGDDERHRRDVELIADPAAVVQTIEAESDADRHRHQRNDDRQQIEFRRTGFRAEGSWMFHGRSGQRARAGRVPDDGSTMAVSPCGAIIDPLISIKQMNIIVR
ncbi:hypothetical protein ACFSTI_07765 [Rhizorhabdus histidinilytica]